MIVYFPERRAQPTALYPLALVARGLARRGVELPAPAREQIQAQLMPSVCGWCCAQWRQLDCAICGMPVCHLHSYLTHCPRCTEAYRLTTVVFLAEPDALFILPGTQGGYRMEARVTARAELQRREAQLLSELQFVRAALSVQPGMIEECADAIAPLYGGDRGEEIAAGLLALSVAAEEESAREEDDDRLSMRRAVTFSLRCGWDLKIHVVVRGDHRPNYFELNVVLSGGHGGAPERTTALTWPAQRERIREALQTLSYAPDIVDAYERLLSHLFEANIDRVELYEWVRNFFQ